MTNTITLSKNAGIIAKAAAMALVDNLQFIKSIDKADESDWDGKNGYSAGDTIYINKPARFKPNQSFDATSSILAFVEEKVPLTLDTISSVPVSLSTEELAHDIQLKQIIKRVVKPAVADIAQDIESRVLTKAINNTYNQVGTAGATTFNTPTVLSSGVTLNKYLAPMGDERFLLLESQAMADATNDRKGLFQSATEISKQYKQGWVGQADGYNWLSNNLLPTHTNGTATVGGLTVTTTASEGAAVLAITDSGGGSQTLTAGTRFTIAGIFAVHPVTKQTYNFLQEFVVLNNETASGGAFSSVEISPAMYSATSVSLQNISALPTSTTAINIISGTASTSYQMNLAFHRDSFRFASVPLVMPTAVEFAAQETYEGVTVAIVRAFDVYKRTMVTRMDVLCGLAPVRPEWACVLTS